jgi:DNA-binding transcriptional ArsR family regulator
MPLNWEKLARVSIHADQIRILEFASGRPDERFSPVDLADALGMRLPNVAYHVRVVRDRGLLRPAGTRPRRGAVQHYYKLASDLIA